MNAVLTLLSMTECIDNPRQSEISNFHGVIFADEDIACCQVSMYNSLQVNVGHALRNLINIYHQLQLVLYPL